MTDKNVIFKGMWVHRLSQIDSVARTATCAACGPVEIRLRSKNDPTPKWDCFKKRQADHRRRWANPEYRSYVASRRQFATKPTKEARDRYALRHFLKQLGLTEDDYRRVLAEQGGCCAICRLPIERPHIDHDHKTNKFRGLLCKFCNTMLGFARDLPATLRSAAIYLETRNLTGRSDP